MNPLNLVLVEFALKGTAGLVLLFLPLTAIKVLGLPRSETAFWPQLLGALLLALAAVTYMNVTSIGRGLGLAGAFVINITLALVLAGLLHLKRGPQTRRGRGLLWLTAGALGLLALVELAYI